MPSFSHAPYDSMGLLLLLVRPAHIPSGFSPRQMGPVLAAGYLGEAQVKEFLGGVGDPRLGRGLARHPTMPVVAS